VFSAVAVRGGPPFAVTLVVNGTEVGTLPVAPRWQEYGFEVPRASLRGGLESFELQFSAPAAPEDARLELEIESLRLVPR
jgi:hypothetical protein